MNEKISILSDHVSSTALNTSAFRAMESKRPDALFNDYLAERFLVNKDINFHLLKEELSGWTLVLRTYLIDRYIENLSNQGIDSVLNLGAGLDTRPYRLNLRKELKWFEADYGTIISLKEEKLASEKPHCDLCRISIDLSDEQSRKSVLKKIGEITKNTLVLSEGLLMYLSPETVISLGKELFDLHSAHWWLMDLTNKPFVEWAKKNMLKNSEKIATNRFRIQFYPDDTAEFLCPLGWSIEEYISYAQGGLELNRFPNGFSEVELQSEPGLQAIGVGLFRKNV